MALALKDRVKETTTTTGTGTYTLAGAVTGFEAFSSVGDGNTTYYACTDGTDFEVGIGTYTASGTTLARTTILQSSNSDSAVSWSSGTKTIFCAQPAEKAVFRDASGAINLPDGSSTTNYLGIGDSDDLKLYHNGTNSIVQDVGSGILVLAGDGAVQLTKSNLSENMLRALADGAVELYYDNVKKLETTADGVTITSTDDGAVDAPILALFRDSASPADSDDIGRIEFKGKNDAAQDVDYGLIIAEINDASDGTEGGELQFVHIHDGSGVTPMQHKFGRVFINNGPLELAAGVNLRFEGATSNSNETTLTVTDPTADRTITLPDATGTVQLTDGSGASLTSLNASELSSGTVPNARLDAQLQDVAGLAVTNGGFIVGDGSNFVLETGATARTSLGLGSSATADTGISNGNVAVFTSGAADNDFLRIDGTSIEGRSASEVLSDIGATTAAAAADEATALAIALG
jgi:hypothetical protein